MAEDTTKYQEIWGKVIEGSQYDYLSTILDFQLKEDLLEHKRNMISYYLSTGTWDENTDPYEAHKQLNSEMFPNQFVVDTDKRINFAVKENVFTIDFDLDPELALNGANLIIGTMDEKNHESDPEGQPFFWGILKEYGEQHQKMMPEEQLEKFKEVTKGMGIIHGKHVEEYLIEQILQDLIDGNAYNLERALIPASTGEGYQIGIFYIPEDGSSKDGILIGAMLDGDKFRHITHEELVGASASEHLLDYVTSYFFNYSHKKIQKLKEEGMESEELYTWEGDERVSDWYPQFFNMMGKLEFQYTIKPLSDMLEEKAKEKYGKKYRPGKDFLSDDESRAILKLYMDRLDRFYKNDYIPDITKPYVRAISNFWSVDMRFSELFYNDPAVSKD